MEIFHNDWAELLNPELKGKIAYGDPVNSSSAFQCLIAALYDMGEGDPMSDKAWEWVEHFIANLDGVSLDSSSKVYKGTAEGEYVVGLIWEDPVADYVRQGVEDRVHVRIHVVRPVLPDQELPELAVIRFLELRIEELCPIIVKDFHRLTTSF